MGAILRPSLAMGGYHVEVRRESFSLGAPAGLLDVTSDAWSVPTDNVAAILAALDQVTAHSAYRAGDFGMGRAFAVARAADSLSVSGSGHLYACPHGADQHTEQCRHQSIELEYRDIKNLRQVLT